MTQPTNPHVPTMPPPAPLAMPAQNFAHRPPVRALPKAGQMGWRLSVFLPAFCVTALLMWGLHGVLMQSGMSPLEWVLLSLIGLTFVWVTLAVSTVGIALIARLRRAPRCIAPTHSARLNIALLVPIYNEVARNVFANASAMIEDLAQHKTAHRYSVFVLSDSTDPAIRAQELRAFATLRQTVPDGFDVFYRQRPENTDKKVGNLMDWITGWGAAYEAMLVLDADSLMSARAIEGLAQALADDPDAGLIQSFPQLIGAHTVFARIQQFSNVAYGWLLAEGLARWAQSEGNYWGHNAIIRTHAFAAAAGLPYLRGRNGSEDLILSHDFVEASLLRRAGWRVRFVPEITGSFEETPATLVDYVLRDQRWCRGNLQHLRLLGTQGLHPVSRFHLFQGAAAYLMSPAWFVLLVFWALLGRDAETNVIRYFNESNPLFPNWPPEMSHIDSAVFLIIMYAMLLTPKLTGAGLIALSGKAVRAFGGRATFVTSVCIEIALSILYAPILMVQQSKAVLRAAFTRSPGWQAQRRGAQQYPLRTLLRFHAVETGLGAFLVVGIGTGLVSLWLLPIATSLICAVPLSALSALPLTRAPAALRMDSPHSKRQPAISRRAEQARGKFASL